MKCERCGVMYGAGREYLPSLCNNCDRAVSERMLLHERGRPQRQRSERQKRREPF